jgi:antirestriction protein ArdC
MQMKGERMDTANRLDIHQTITDQIVAAIEAGAPEFKMPWHRAQGSLMRPINVATGKRYQGINIVALWLAGEQRGYAAPLWATYRQWQTKGAQVRKGERGAVIVFYKELEFTRANESGEPEDVRTLFARASHVFNVAQVDGYAPREEMQPPSPSAVEAIESAERLLASSGAVFVEGGDRAFYRPADDTIAMPDRHRFQGSDTISPTEAWYATKLHELVHWSGAKHRLDRDLSGRFGSDAYAMEELVAELGASFLCADLNVTTELRPDHAAYIASWLAVLRSDKRAVFTAASAAQRAAAYLAAFAADCEPQRPTISSEPVPNTPGEPK